MDANRLSVRSLWSRLQRHLALVVSVAAPLVGVAGLTGCDQPASLKRYQVPHEQSPSNPTTAGPAGQMIPQRMLATILPVGDQAWFFKAMGPERIVDEAVDGYRTWQASVTIDDTQTPEWTLPEGWTKDEQGASRVRFATLKARNGLEISVTRLPLPPDKNLDTYILQNINRWRGQLQLDPIDQGALESTAERITIADQPAVFADLTGRAPAAGAAPMDSFGGQSPSGARGGRAGQRAAADPAADSTAPGVAGGGSTNSRTAGLTYSVPAGWRPGRTSAMRLAAFDVGDASSGQAEVTVIALGPQAGSLPDNVNRWRGQIGHTDRLSSQQVEELVSTITVDDQSGQLVRLMPPDGDATSRGATKSEGGADAILAAVIPLPNRTLFIKMQGSAPLVEQQAPVFESFVKSIKFD